MNKGNRECPTGVTSGNIENWVSLLAGMVMGLLMAMLLRLEVLERILP